jgi:hypothetical protein
MVFSIVSAVASIAMVIPPSTTDPATVSGSSSSVTQRTFHYVPMGLPRPKRAILANGTMETTTTQLASNSMPAWVTWRENTKPMPPLPTNKPWISCPICCTILARRVGHNDIKRGGSQPCAPRTRITLVSSAARPWRKRDPDRLSSCKNRRCCHHHHNSLDHFPTLPFIGTWSNRACGRRPIDCYGTVWSMPHRALAKTTIKCTGIGTNSPDTVGCTSCVRVDPLYKEPRRRN